MSNQPVSQAELQRSISSSVEAENFKPLRKSSIILRRFFRNKGAVLGLVMLLLLVITTFLVKAFSPYAIDDLDFMNVAVGPSEEHWLGTSQAGADLLTLLAHGTAKSLMIGVCVGVCTPMIAAVYGCTMAYFGKWTDRIMLFILETMIMAPGFLIVAIVMSGRGGSWLILVLLLVIFGWMGAARLIRGLTLSLVDREYVKAARYMGVPSFRIIRRHLMPNIASLIVLEIALGIFSAILAEVAYSFLGIGIKVPDTSLGVLISQASSSVTTYPWLFWGPVITLMLITGPLALMNDGLRDAFDPNSNAGGAA